MRERIKRLRQLTRTAVLMLFNAGPLALAKQSLAWLRGQRRYYRPPEQVAKPPQSRLSMGRVELAFRRISQRISPKTGVSYLVALTGLPSELEHQAFALIRDLNRWAASAPQHEVILIPDGALWAHIARSAQPPVRVLEPTDDVIAMPGALFNRGARVATKPCIAFGLVGVNSLAWLLNAERLAASFAAGMTGVTGLRGESELRQGALSSHRVRWLDNGFPDPRYGLAESPSGWLEMLDLIPIHNCVLSREALLQVGGMSELSPNGFWWQACVALARRGRLTEVDLAPPKSRYTLETYPLGRPPLPVDTVARLAVRMHAPDDMQRLYADLPELGGAPSPAEPPLRVTVLGGPFEPHHNQIFFYNVFQRIEGQGVLSWRAVDDEYATPYDIECADVVIYSRVRSDNGRKLLGYARHIGRPVLYMLDDNWFTMSREWPDYAGMIEPGTAFYENALACIRDADAVVTYSPVMREYLASHARQVFLQTMPIDLRAFPAPAVRRDSGLTIGYAGSPRQGDIAFRALVELARRYPELTVFYLGWGVPDVLREIPARQVKLLPGTHSYADYARQLAALAPDIGFAPLGRTEAERAKNPTKYLDYAAVKCAGVYSAVEPYTVAVRHGETGILTAGETVEDWVQAAETLMHDRALLNRIRAAAYADVRCTYEVDVVLPDVLAMLRQLAGRGA